MVTLLVPVLLVPILLFLYGCYLWWAARYYQHLPGILGNEFPIIGNLHKSFRSFFMTHNALLKILEKILPENNGVCCLWFYFVPVVAVSNPDIIEKLAVHPAFADKEPLVYENVPNLWKGTFPKARADKEWKLQRKELNNTLKKWNLENYHNIFVKMTNRMIENLKYKKGILNMERYVLISSMESILETHFACSIEEIDHDVIYKLITRSGHILAEAFLNPIVAFIGNFLVQFRIFNRPVDDILNKCVEQAKSNLKRTNMIEDNSDILYLDTIVHRNIINNKTIQEMKQEIAHLMLVGSHTVTVSVCGVLLFLATNPEFQEKVWQEQNTIFGNSNRDSTLDDMKKMEYLDRVFKETLRFISGPTLVRKTNEEINIDGIIIPKDARVIISSRVMRMDSQYWENPFKFDPDRYLREDKTKNYKQAFSVFGLGIRNCPGMQYAYNEGKVMVSSILRHFKVVTDKQFEDIEFDAKIMMEAANGYNMTLIRR